MSDRNNAEWLKQQFAIETGFARQLLASPKGSLERRQLFERCYRDLAAFLEVHDPGGAETDLTNVVLTMIKRCTLEGGSVIDIGCATGNLLCALVENGYRATGIDVSDQFVAIARSRLAALGCENSVQQSDVLEYASGARFDCAVLDNVIEHMHPDSVVDVLSKCHSIIKAGGSVIILTPHRFSGPHDVSRYFLPLGAKAQGLHLHEFSFTELAAACRSAGFTEIRGFLYHPRLLRRFGMVPASSVWAGRKAVIAERLFQRAPLSRLLSVRRSLTRALVALMFPAICVARKA